MGSGAPRPTGCQERFRRLPDDGVLSGRSDFTVDTVSGAATSASVTALGLVSLDGTFDTGTFQLGTASTPGQLNLAMSATLTATSANVLYGPVWLSNPASKFLVNGALTVGGAHAGTPFAVSSLFVDGGAVAQAG